MPKKTADTGPNLNKVLPYIFIVAAIVGLTASFALTYDKIQVLKNASYVPSCNINPIISCGSVMKTEQSSLLGVPNTIFGLMAFSMLLTLGAAMLAGASFGRWMWRTVNAGALAGFLFFVYLFFEGVFRIHAICPYCFAVWMIVPPVLWYVTLYNLKAGHIRLGLSQRIRNFVIRHHGDILFLWYALVFLILLTRFWYYWKTLL